MKDFRLTAKIQNNRILEMIESSGYASIAAFSKAAGIPRTLVDHLVNLKGAPMKADGSWKQSAQKLADALCCHPTMLFSDEQLTMKLKRNTSQQTFTDHQLRVLGYDAHSPEDFVMQHQRYALLGEAFSHLRDSEQEVLFDRFGLVDGNEKTFGQIANEQGRTVERIRQIEAKAIRKLRHPDTLQDLK